MTRRLQIGAVYQLLRGVALNSRISVSTRMAHSYFTEAEHAALYAKFRPDYPKQVAQAIVSYLREKRSPPFLAAADIGCGPGQSTHDLAPEFESVTGVDVSENQIKEANAKERLPNVRYKVGTGESFPFEDESLELVTAAQAAHWFDLDKFYAEVKRVLKPNGVLALYGYGMPQASCPKQPEATVDQVLQQFYNDKCYWPSNRFDVENKYEKYQLPFPGWIRNDTMKIECDWTVRETVAYVSTWSGYQQYIKKHPSETRLLEDLQQRFIEALPNKEEKEHTMLQVSFDVFLLMGRKSN